LVQPQERVLPRRKSCTLTILCVPQSQMQRQSPSPFELTSLTRSMATELAETLPSNIESCNHGIYKAFFYVRSVTLGWKMERWSVPPGINALPFVKYEPLAKAAIGKKEQCEGTKA
jgi:hypothetical protein